MAYLNMIKVESLVAESPIQTKINGRISKEKIITAFKRTQKSFKRTKTVTCVAFPIPGQQCVPTMASLEQVEAYESKFIKAANGYLGNLTVFDLLKIFSYSDKQIPIGKVSFLVSFFQKIRVLDINLDVAILCNDLQSQIHLLPILKANNLNCDPLTSHAVNKDTYGVIVKMRKADKPINPIKTATAVDIVMVYDSAISVPYKDVLAQFSGVYYADPQTVYISTLDSADIRCYNSSAQEELNWNTRYKDIESAQILFHQNNRRAGNESLGVWNDFMASQVAEWAAKKDNTPYTFYRPQKKSSPWRVYNLWGGGHPLNHSPKKPVLLINHPLMNNAVNAAVPQVTNTSLIKSSRIAVPAPAREQQKLKMKLEQHDATLASSFSSNAPTSRAAAGATLTSGPLSSSPAHLALTPTGSASASNATNNVPIVAGAFASTAPGNDHPAVSSATGKKRGLADTKTNEASSSSAAKKAKRSDRFLPAFDFSSVFDEAMQEFEKQLNSINTQI